MKLLTKIKLINWHYFWNETIEVKPIVFLTGLNGSGKSTLIDAFEVVLLGDTTGRSFNKAALEKSSRTLKGYLRGELGDTVDGGFRYLRNGRFTSYIALEFHDDLNDKDFVMGCVFDSFEDGSEEHHFFNIDGKIPENEFINNKVPFSYKELVNFFNNEGITFKFFDSNKQYQEFLKKKFGGLKDKYFSLLKKSTSFSPITDITTFITEYVCDPQANLDLSHLQENIVQYRKLQVESENIKKRIEKLENISSLFKTYKTHEKDFLLNKYLIEKCELFSSEQKLNAFKEEVEKAKERVKEIDEELKDYNDDLITLQNRKIGLIQDKAQNNVAQITRDLYDQKKKIETSISKIKNDLDSFKKAILNYISEYKNEADHLLTDLNKINKDLLEDDKDEEIVEILVASKEVIKFSNELENKINKDILSVSKEDLLNFKKVLGIFKENVSTLAISLARTISNIDKKIGSIKEEQVLMKEGNKPFDSRLINIKNELKRQLKNEFGKDIDVELYCDLIDIKDLSWSNAVEGYLYSQKFNLFVAPKYYLAAYNILKDLLAEYHFYGTALIDQEKIIERNYRYEDDSLASEIETSHEGARSYTNFLIGRLKKAETLEEARESGNGITRACDLYRNFTISKINPRLYSESFIGRNVNDRLLNEKSNQLKGYIENLNFYKELKNVINNANNLELISSGEIEYLAGILESANELDGLYKSLDYVKNELNEHDTALIQSLDKRINDVDSDIKELQDSKDALILEKGTLNKEIDNITSEKIINEERNIESKRESLKNNYSENNIDKEGEEKFNSLLSENKTYIEIRSIASQEISRLQYLYNNIFNQLVKERREYCHEYHLSYDFDNVNNTDFENELVDFRDVRLPQYVEKINDSYNKATQQFKDDFIFKLRGAIEDVEEQIENLNEALKQSQFGKDSYRFTCKAKTELKRYYEMLRDDLILECGEGDTRFLDKYQDVMEDLFKQIVDTSSTNDTSNELLSNIEKYTDYRSYLDFDLIVYNIDTKEEQRLSKMIKKKSGGETQTPFYIAVLASFAQLYHVNDSGELANTSRLIIFDEAFSKMDRGRIKEAVRLLRKFNLQVIISCPTDKVADITELVDETLVVLHNNNSSCVRNFSKVDSIK